MSKGFEAATSGFTSDFFGSTGLDSDFFGSPGFGSGFFLFSVDFGADLGSDFLFSTGFGAVLGADFLGSADFGAGGGTGFGAVFFGSSGLVAFEAVLGAVAVVGGAGGGVAANASAAAFIAVSLSTGLSEEPVSLPSVDSAFDTTARSFLGRKDWVA